MITKNFDAMMKTWVFGRIWPTGISNVNNLTETHYQEDNNTVTKYSYITANVNNGRLQSYAMPTGYQTGNGTKSSLYYLVLGEKTSNDEVLPAENYYDYTLTHLPSHTSLYSTLPNTNDVSFITENGVSYLKVNHMFTNTSGSTKIIGEIGLFIQAYIDMYNSSTPGTLLIYRKVLPQQQTVAANGTLTVDLKIPLTSLTPNKPSA